MMSETNDANNDAISDTLPLVLASTSPRRRQLFAALGLECEAISPDVDERALPYKTPREFALKAALAKAQAGAAMRPHAIVVGADTIVVLENEVLGKPDHEDDAFRMLSALQGRTHQVITGVCVASPGGSLLDAVTAQVTFRDVTPEEIRAYIASGEPMDKAGAYGAQGRGRDFLAHIDGDFFTVMGLPIARMVEMLDGLMDVRKAREALRRITPESVNSG